MQDAHRYELFGPDTQPAPAGGANRNWPPGPRAASRPQRGRVFARFCLVAAVLTAVVLGVTGFLAFASVDLASSEPVAAALGWLTLFGFTAASAVVLVLLSLVALVRCRPRLVAGLAVLAALGLPALAVTAAVSLGVPVLKANVVADLGADAAVVQRLVDALGLWDALGDPLREALRSAAAIGNS